MGIDELTRQLREHLDRIKSLEGRLRWHVARAETTGRHKKAEEYAAELELARAGAKSLAEELRSATQEARAASKAVDTAESFVDEADRLLRPRTALDAEAIRAWALVKNRKDPLQAIRGLAMAAELYGMQNWDRKDFRESVTDWFWNGIKGAKTYSEKTAIRVVLETARSFMEDDVSLEELLEELHEGGEED